jgi:hypothetical protein
MAECELFCISGGWQNKSTTLSYISKTFRYVSTTQQYSSVTWRFAYAASRLFLVPGNGENLFENGTLKHKWYVNTDTPPLL